MDTNKCITKCYPPKETILHPLFLVPITSSQPFCLINSDKYYKKCNDDELSNDDSFNYFIPKMSLNEKEVLNLIYNINSWNDVYKYMKQNIKENKYTIDRIFTYSWISFNKTLKVDTEKIINCYNLWNETYLKSKKTNFPKIIYEIKKNFDKYNKSDSIHTSILNTLN